MSADSPLPVLIVGNGIAGMTIAHGLEDRGISYRLMDDGHRSSSSLAAAGLYNPLILKRLRKTWQADRFMPGIEVHYRHLENRLKSTFLHPTGLLRRLDTIKELNDWEMRKSVDGFSRYLGRTITDPDWADHLDIGQGLLEVPVAGWVDVVHMLQENERYQKGHGRYIESTFDDRRVECSDSAIHYDKVEYSALILCRGYKEWKGSRFFPDLPFTPAKGQSMILRVPGLGLDRPLHLGIFILPLGDDLYRIGSTYSWSDFNEESEEDKRKELLNKFSSRCSLPYTITKECAGVRPAVKDRRPLLGRSTVDRRILLFNGLGSRGILMAPVLADLLCRYLIADEPLWGEVDIDRFA